MSLGVGEVFAGYTIERLLGAGGMGEVYLAQHPRLPRQDALKVLNPDISDDGEFRERFNREANLAAALTHPHIVTVHDRGDHNNQLWIATQYIEGTDAAQLLRDRFPAGMPVADATIVITAIADALDYAHEKGLVHRDVKPANILVSNPDRMGRRQVYLADFGIARPLSDAGGLTATNTTLGTFLYSAPEQLMGDELDGRADQYALAATAYHLLTGAPPFAATANPVALISQHLNAAPPPLSKYRPELAPLDDVVARGLAKERTQRYPTCAALATAVTERAARIPAVLPNATTQAAGASASSATTQIADPPVRHRAPSQPPPTSLSGPSTPKPHALNKQPATPPTPSPKAANPDASHVLRANAPTRLANLHPAAPSAAEPATPVPPPRPLTKAQAGPNKSSTHRPQPLPQAVKVRRNGNGDIIRETDHGGSPRSLMDWVVDNPLKGWSLGWIAILVPISLAAIIANWLGGQSGSSQQANNSPGTTTASRGPAVGPRGGDGQLPAFKAPADLGVNCQYPAARPASKKVDPPKTGKVPTDPATVNVSMSTDQGNIGLILNNAEAPCTVNSFASLTQKGFFDGTDCHRLTNAPKLSVLQCGDPTATGTGGPGYSFANEYPTNQYAEGDVPRSEPVLYPRGALAMANAGPETNGSQFFLVYRDSQLPPNYTVFGTIDGTGLATLDKIAAAGVAGGGDDGQPALPVKIESMMLD